MSARVEPNQKEIEGVRLEKRKVIEDERGAVLHWLRSDSELFDEFGEVYFSSVKPGVVKAWKRHFQMTQNFVVPHGEAEFVIYDDRPNSLSKGLVSRYILGRENYSLLQVPPMLWYGFRALGSETPIIGNCTNLCHDPAESETLPLTSPSIPFQWPS